MKGIYIIALCFTMAVLSSCQKNRDGMEIADISTITFSASFRSSSSSSTMSSSTRATATAFEDGDRVGVYVSKGDIALKGSFNAIDNKLFAYFATGDSLGGVPTAAYYPDKTTSVAMYAYYPFAPSMTNALAIPFRVTSDIKSSDLCYASLPKQSPSATPLSLTFSHKLTKLMVNVNLDAVASKVKSIKSITIRGIKDSCYLNLSDGSVRVSDNSMSDIETTSSGIFILPAQSLATPRLIDVVCEAQSGDNIALSYYSDSGNPLTLQSGTSYTINLIASDSKSLQLSDKTLVEPWTESATTSTLNQSASNHFTLHWLLPSARYASITDITLHIRNSSSGILSPYRATNTKAQSGNDNLKASFNFDLIATSLGYPYSIESISFLTATGDTVQNCKSLIAANVYRQGDLTIGVQQDNILTITTGTITNWNGENLGGAISGGGVANAFALTMFEPLTFIPSLDYTAIGSVTLTIEGAIYTFSGSKLTTTPSSNVMVATVQFALPDDNGRTPSIYPYTIESVVLGDASSSAIYTGYCDIAVSSGAGVNINLFKGGRIELSTKATIEAWGASTLPDGEVIYTGPVSTNPLSVVYCNGTATSVTECTSVAKVEITTAAGAMILSPYTMTGTRFAATSKSSLDIATATGERPTNYPFAITKVRLLKADGTVLEDITPTNPIWVYQSGILQFQIMK